MTDFGFQAAPSGLGGLNYLGTWDAALNIPTIVSGVGTSGDYYIVSVAGTTDIDGISDWEKGDWIIFNGLTWQKIDNSEVSSYNYVEEEGVTLPQQNILNFQGAGVVASDDPANKRTNVTITGSIGSTIYYMNQSVAEVPYRQFSSIPTSAVEQDVSSTIGAGVTSVIAAFQTPSGVPNTTNIPAGLWQFFLHLYSGASTDDWDIYCKVYSRDTLGVETLLFSSDPVSVIDMSTTTTMYITDGVFPSSTLLTTDRIVVKVFASNTGTGNQTIHFITEGSQHYSVASTTLNQVVPTGTVTNVSGTSPIVSSGGTTPAISIPKADNATNGYLSSTDWSTFNNKVGQAYSTIQEEGTGLTQRSTLNFIGSGVTATDDAGNNRTNVTIPIQPAYSRIQEEGANLTQRATLNFIGTGITATDDAANNRTNVTLASSTGSFGGVALATATGIVGYITMPYAGTITGWQVIGDIAGNCVFDVWKTAAGIIPTVANTITGTEKPTLTAQQITSDLVLTTWTTTVNSGDIIAINLNSASTLSKAWLTVFITKNP